jgi:hypothetical protein
MTPSFDPSPLIPYVEGLGLKYHYIRDDSELFSIPLINFCEMHLISDVPSQLYNVQLPVAKIARQCPHSVRSVLE